MAKLPLDKRGYPVPWNIMRDKEGTPHFTINDHRKAKQCVVEQRCPICGDELGATRWFCGGPISAFHERGAYFDQPMHDECVHYAIQVCPYLAAPKYAGRIDTGTLKPENTPEGMLFLDPTVLPDRPEVFVLVEAIGNTVRREVIDRMEQFYLTPLKPYVNIEIWRHGAQVRHDDAKALIGRQRKAT